MGGLQSQGCIFPATYADMKYRIQSKCREFGTRSSLLHSSLEVTGLGQGGRLKNPPLLYRGLHGGQGMKQRCGTELGRKFAKLFPKLVKYLSNGLTSNDPWNM